MQITGTAILKRDVSPLDCIRQTKNFLAQFKKPQGIKVGSEVNFEVIPMTLTDGVVKINYVHLGAWTEYAFIKMSDLKSITFNKIEDVG